MEITKRIVAAPEDMELLFNTCGRYSVRYYEFLHWEKNEKAKYKITVRADETVIKEIKKTRSIKKLFELKKDDTFIESINEEIKKLKKRIKNLQNLIGGNYENQ